MIPYHFPSSNAYTELQSLSTLLSDLTLPSPCKDPLVKASSSRSDYPHRRPMPISDQRRRYRRPTEGSRNGCVRRPWSPWKGTFSVISHRLWYDRQAQLELCAQNPLYWQERHVRS